MANPISWTRIKAWFTGASANPPIDARYRLLMDDLRGKSIAIVGNSQSLLLDTHGQDIDSHDIVVRMNMGFPSDPVAQGRRFDVWCFSTIGMARQATSLPPAKHAVWMSPKSRDEFDGSVPCCFYPLECWDALQAHLGSRPSVGAMTIDLVSRAVPGAVSIFGFDFKRTETFYNKSTAVGPHDYQAEERYAMDNTQRPGWRFIASESRPQ